MQHERWHKVKVRWSKVMVKFAVMWKNCLGSISQTDDWVFIRLVQSIYFLATLNKVTHCKSQNVKIKHLICDKLGRDLYLLGVNALVQNHLHNHLIYRRRRHRRCHRRRVRVILKWLNIKMIVIRNVLHLMWCLVFRKKRFWKKNGWCRPTYIFISGMLRETLTFFFAFVHYADTGCFFGVTV